MKFKIPYLCFLGLGILYFLLPTQNAYIDSWYYAACVKYNQHLIHSHHLLYNVAGSLWHQFLQFFNPGIEAIHSLNYLNALAATGSLFALFHILRLLDVTPGQAQWLTLFSGVSFGFMRYATDAETYILPLFFSLLSTYFFVRNKRYDLLFSALFAALAILMHQLHLWWALAMFISLIIRKPFKPQQVFLFVLPFLLVPAVYYLAYLQQEDFSSFFTFISGEYHKGNAGLDPSPKSLLLTFINFIRSFIQVHGQVADIFMAQPLLNLSIGLCTIGLFIYFAKTRTTKLFIKQEKSPYSSMLLLAFILHLLFAFLSSGNAEFMVILPFLLVLYLGSRYTFKSCSLIPAITLSFFMWNMGMAIIPAHIYDLNRVDHQVAFTLKYPEEHFLWRHKPLVENIVTYRKGFLYTAHFIPVNAQTQSLLDSLVQSHIPVYSDLSNPDTRFSREDFVDHKLTIGERYRISEVDTWENIYGKNHIYQIIEKGD